MMFPDEYVTRFFFKFGLNHRVGGRVLEIGCGSGHNLHLFAHEGWSVVGIEIEGEAISVARKRMEQADRGGGGNRRHNFIEHDLSLSFPAGLEGLFDVILLPSVTYYLGLEGRRRVLNECSNLLERGGLVFLRERLLDDYRYGRGVRTDRNTFRLNIEETGEPGQSVSFFSETEVVEGFISVVGADPSDLTVLRMRFDNLQKGTIVSNSDIVVWGSKSS